MIPVELMLTERSRRERWSYDRRRRLLSGSCRISGSAAASGGAGGAGDKADRAKETVRGNVRSGDRDFVRCFTADRSTGAGVDISGAVEAVKTESRVMVSRLFRGRSGVVGRGRRDASWRDASGSVRRLRSLNIDCDILKDMLASI